MHSDYARLAQSPYGLPQTAEGIRDRLRVDDKLEKYLRLAHELLDELETALHGPHPRADQMPQPEDANHPGLRTVLDDTSKTAASLTGRLQTLINSL